MRHNSLITVDRMGVHFQRARLLFEQSRPGQAENELRIELIEEPDNALALALLGLCLAELRRPDEALHAAHRAVHLAPDLAFAHYALADVLHDREELKDARAAAAEALRLDPETPDYYALLAGVEFKQGRWLEALDASERGLAVDAEHVGCLNLRALALMQLRRYPEASEAIEIALRRDPNNAVTHANRGWAFLRHGKAEAALESFREALRLDSDFDLARQGVIEALKGRFAIYNLLLRLFRWLAGLNRRAQWLLVAVGVAAAFALPAAAEAWPALRAVVWPVLAAYLAAGMLIWISDPLFNLLLRLDRFGRLALSPEQRTASNWVGGCLASAASLAVAWLATRLEFPGLLYAAGMSLLMTLPISGVFDCPPGRSRRLMTAYALGVAGVAAVGLTLHAVTGWGVVILMLAVLGAFSSGWAALLLMLRKS
jgi:tetratricopeptide (TPR) repeat protein